jgi:hypothetical protein
MNDKDFNNLLSLIVTHYNVHGNIPSAEKAEELYKVPGILVEQAFKSEAFTTALTEYGIVLEHFSLEDDWQANVLTPLQLSVANQVMDLTDLRTLKKKLQDLSVSTRTYDAWLKDPVFQNYLRTRAERLLDDNAHEVNLAVMAKIQSGDLAAVKFFKELTGEYVPQRANSNQVDTHSIIVGIIEIIDEEVLDQDTQLRIADRIKALISRETTASALLNPEGAIAQPEVVPIRRIEI